MYLVLFTTLTKPPALEGSIIYAIWLVSVSVSHSKKTNLFKPGFGLERSKIIICTCIYVAQHLQSQHLQNFLIQLFRMEF